MHTHIFISGLHRSGTTVFTRDLISNNNVSGFQNTGVPMDEGQHLQNVMEPAKSFGGPGKFGFNDKSYLDENSNLANEDSRIKIAESWNKYWDQTKEILVEKSPPNIIRTRFLQYLYPDAYFITITRHPVPVALATQKWSKTKLHELLLHWIVCHQRYVKDVKYLKHHYLFRYEDYVRDPVQIMQDISSLIQKEVTHNPELILRKSINDKYFQKWDKKYVRSFFRKRYVNQMIEDFQNQLEEFGYSLKSPYITEFRIPK